MHLFQYCCYRFQHLQTTFGQVPSESMPKPHKNSSGLFTFWKDQYSADIKIPQISFIGWLMSQLRNPKVPTHPHRYSSPYWTL